MSSIDCYEWKPNQRDLGMILMGRPSPLEKLQVLGARSRFLGWTRLGDAQFSLEPHSDCPDLLRFQSQEMTVCFKEQQLPRSRCFFYPMRGGRVKLIVSCGLPERCWLDEVLA